MSYTTYRVLDRQKDLCILELPAGVRTVKMMGVDLKRKGIKPIPKTLMLPYTQLIVTPQAVFATQSTVPMESYDSPVTFPIMPNIYNNFSFCTGELADRSDKEIADSFYLSEWGLPDMWSCKTILPKLFREPTPQLAVRAWENISKARPELVTKLINEKCSFVPLQFVVKAKVELSNNGNIVPTTHHN